MADGIRQLIDALQEELLRQQEMARLLEGKLDAMRRYDMPRLEALNLAEQRLLRGVQASERKRRQAARLAREQLWPRQRREGATARQIADAAPEPARTELLELTGLLRETCQKVQRLARVTSQATSKILGHIDHIFRVVAQSGREIGLYGRMGKTTLLEQNRLVDALA